MPLQQIAGRAYYLPGANNLGVVAGSAAIAIDTGIDKDSARALRKALDAAGLTLGAIISTHHHADHVGGNAALLRAYPAARVYAPPLEAALIEHPILEPSYLSGGARPPAALRNRWLLAPGSPVHGLLGELATIAAGASWRAELADTELEIIGLPGHSPAQIGVALDGVCFAADGCFGPAVLAKHGIPYAHDVAAQLAAIETLAARDDAWLLPGHGELAARADVPALLAANRAAVLRGSELVLAALAEPGELGSITARVLAALGQSLAGIPQYAIFSGAVAAHLSYLEQQGRARVELGECGLVWRRDGT